MEDFNLNEIFMESENRMRESERNLYFLELFGLDDEARQVTEGRTEEFLSGFEAAVRMVRGQWANQFVVATGF